MPSTSRPLPRAASVEAGMKMNPRFENNTSCGVEAIVEARQTMPRHSSNKRRSTPLLQQRVSSTLLATAACVACLVLSNNTPQAAAFMNTAPISRTRLWSAPQVSHCGVERRLAEAAGQQRNGRRRLRHRPVSSTTCMAYYGAEDGGKDGPAVDPFDETEITTSQGQHVINWWALCICFAMVRVYGSWSRIPGTS